ncbi:MAG: TIGR01212 family radical SAM protein [Bacteroidales bacterium]|nr:TIGR01212 family radical SAM protein [Bacteroidales bacterium]MCF8387115.1 TIGR01212 family radical SAM protein [Bacteroidales bacterium]MCF8398015.1 TIGR01212 family radical SAM protein [Bacteroidales bacterium]
MEFEWGHQRRFNAYANYFRKHFGERIQKLTVDAGFTCPNRDGSIAVGGCTYCNNDAFNPSYCHPSKSVAQQIKEGIEFHKNRYRKASKYLAYFQAYSNTYATLDYLKKIYDQALRFQEVVGLVIGTRPDCIDDEKLDYFQHLAKSKYIILEYGIESIYNETLQKINRGHRFEQTVEAIEKTASKGIKTGAHLIFGLPGESKSKMLKEAEVISKLPLNNIKFHQLQIIKGTPMEKEFLENPRKFTFFSLEEYIEFIIDFLVRLSPLIVVERFAGEVPPRFLAGPGWGHIRNDQILNRIELKLKERNIWQGKYFKSGN